MSESTYEYDSDALEERKAEHSIHPLLLSRTSPREMTGEDIPDDDLMTLFEAARWAPSFYGQEPWRFMYAKRNTNNWQKFWDLLWPMNQQWAHTASALVVIASKIHLEYKGKTLVNPAHSFDTGSAWMSLALEGTARGFVVHGIGGFEYEKAYEVLGVPKDTHNIDAMIVIGKRPAKADRKAERMITQRNPINSFVFEGDFVLKDLNYNINKKKSH